MLRSIPLRLYLTDVLGNAVSGKLKFKFKGKEEWTSPFIALLQGRTTEIILRDPVQLQYVADAAEAAALLPGADLEQLEQLRKIIDKKKSTIGTKVQLKPSFTDGVCETLAIVVKWGGEVSWLVDTQKGLLRPLVIRRADGWCCGSSLMLRGTKHATSRKTCAKVKRTVSDYAQVKMKLISPPCARLHDHEQDLARPHQRLHLFRVRSYARTWNGSRGADLTA